MWSKKQRPFVEPYMESGELKLPSKSITALETAARGLKGVSDVIDGASLENRLSYFRVHPLLLEMEIYAHLIENGTVSDSDRQKLIRLERNYHDLTKSKPTQQMFAANFVRDNIELVRFNANNREPGDLKQLLIQNGACYADKRKLGGIVDAFYADSMIGGTTVFSVQDKRKRNRFKDRQVTRKSDSKVNPILAVGKFMLGVDRKGEVVLSSDHFSTGNYHAKSIADWVKDDKLELFAYGPAMLHYVAEKVGATQIVFTDTEMAEFARLCGVGRKQTFDKLFGQKVGDADNRKIGILANPQNSAGVWQHSLYAEKSGRYFTMPVQPLNAHGLATRVQHTLSEIKQIGSPKARIDSKYAEKSHLVDRFSYASTGLRIMEDLFHRSHEFKRVREEYNGVADSIGSKGVIVPDFK